jgi:hypothetical protein
LILSLSGIHILHSRSSGPEVRTSACYLFILLLSVAHKTLLHGDAATFAFLLSAKSLLILAGIGFFICGTVCFNPCWFLLFPFLFFATESIYAIYSKAVPLPVFIVSQIVVFSSAALFYVITDIPNFIFMRYLPDLKMGTNIGRLIVTNKEMINFARDRATREKISERVKPPKWYWLAFYPELLVRVEGWAMTFAATAGLALLAYHRSNIGLYIALQGIFVFSFIVVAPYKCARVILPFVPLFCIYVAYALTQISIFLFAPIAIWIFIRALIYAIRIIKQTSGIKKAFEFIKKQGADMFQCTSAPFIMIYGPPGALPQTPVDFEVIFRCYTQGIRYLFVEHHHKFPGIVNDTIIPYIEKNVAPVFTVEDPAVTFFPIKAETEYFSPGDFGLNYTVERISVWNDFVTKHSPEETKVRVYDLNEFFMNNELVLNHPSALFFLGSQLLKDQKYDEALKMLQKAISLNDSPLYKLYVGICHFKLGRKELAKKVLVKIAGDENLRKDIRDTAINIITQC